LAFISSQSLSVTLSRVPSSPGCYLLQEIIHEISISLFQTMRWSSSRSWFPLTNEEEIVQSHKLGIYALQQNFSKLTIWTMFQIARTLGVFSYFTIPNSEIGLLPLDMAYRLVLASRLGFSVVLFTFNS
jgi:hypothetical protein